MRSIRSVRWAAAVSLGLPAALLAHVTIYGAAHAAGAVYQRGLLFAAFLALGAYVAALAGRAFNAAARRQRLDEIIAQLEQQIPAVTLVGFASLAWFAFIERLDAIPHGVSLIALAVLALVAALFGCALRAASKIIASAACAARLPRLKAGAGAAAIVSQHTASGSACALSFSLWARPPPTFA